jgi:hypothetical protein
MSGAEPPRAASDPKMPERPKNLTFMVGWLVLLGFYQIFLAWRFGTFFEGTSGDLRADFGGAALEPLYASIGVFALVIAWGGWRLRPWAYVAAWVFQGMVFALAVVVIGLWIDGKDAPVGWLLLDLVFGAYNVWWLTRPDVRRAFRADGGHQANA